MPRPSLDEIFNSPQPTGDQSGATAAAQRPSLDQIFGNTSQGLTPSPQAPAPDLQKHTGGVFGTLSSYSSNNAKDVWETMKAPSSSDFMSSGSGFMDPAASNSTEQLPGGGIKDLAKSVGGAVASSEIGFGNTLGDAAAVQTSAFKDAQDSINKLSETNAKLNQAILVAKKAGKDTSQMEAMAKANQDYIDAHVGMKDVAPSIAKTPEQIYGEALGTGADILSAGEYGNAVKGAEAGKLLPGATAEANMAAEKAAAATRTPAKNALLDIGKGAATTGEVAGAQGVSSAMQQNESATDVAKTGAEATVGGAVLGAGTSAATKVLGGLAKQTISTMSTVPKGAMEHMLENPEETTAAMRAFAADPDHGPQKVLASAEDALGKVQESRDKAYQAALQKVQDETMQFKNGQWYVKTPITQKEVNSGLVDASRIGETYWNPVNLSTKGVKDVITSTLKSFGGESAGGKINLSDVPLPNAYKNDLQEVVDKVYGWKDTSPIGMNRLRQNLDVYFKPGTDTSTAGKQFNRIVTSIKSNLANYVSDRVPQIGEMNSQYATASEFLNDVKNDLKLGKDKVSDQTKLNKLLQVFSPKGQAYKELVGQLGDAGGKQLLTDIAGLTFSKWSPEGLSKYLQGLGILTEGLQHPLGVAAAVAGSSPRVVGEGLSAAAKIGKTGAAQYAKQKTVPFVAGRAVNNLQQP